MYSAPVQYTSIVSMTNDRYWYTIVLWLTLVDQSQEPVAEPYWQEALARLAVSATRAGGDVTPEDKAAMLAALKDTVRRRHQADLGLKAPPGFIKG